MLSFARRLQTRPCVSTLMRTVSMLSDAAKQPQASTLGEASKNSLPAGRKRVSNSETLSYAKPTVPMTAPGRAPDIMTNHRLAPLLIMIPQRFVSLFYNDANKHNAGMLWYLSGRATFESKGWYKKTYMKHLYGGANPQKYLKSKLDFVPWKPAFDFVSSVNKAVGAGPVQDMYSYLRPEITGRMLPHRDGLQHETLKYDMHFSDIPSELLIWDQTDQKWYAVRFPAGGSGYVMDSDMLEHHFHGVQPHARVVQSLMFVSPKRGATLQKVANELQRRANC